jgi:hypothetical protein
MAKSELTRCFLDFGLRPSTFGLSKEACLCNGLELGHRQALWTTQLKNFFDQAPKIWQNKIVMAISQPR